MQLGTTKSERGAKQSAAAEYVCLGNNSPTNTYILNICK